MKRSAYPAVTLLMTVLVATWMVVFAMRRIIPPGPPNRLAAETSDYMLMGSTQSIPWWPIGTEALAEARRLNKPILLFISAAWSKAGREIDESGFQDADVIERMRHDFICIRVDLSERREWGSAYLPVRRATLGFEPSMQIWFLDPQLRMFGSSFRESPMQKLDVAFMITTLRAARARWLEIQQGREVGILPGVEQAEDHKVLSESTPMPNIDFDRLMTAIGRGASPFGGFPVNQFQKLRPNTWRFLLMHGDTEILRQTLDPVLQTPIVDWIDGGFFRLADGTDWMHPEYDKLARQNAEMMAFLALAYARRRDPLYLYLVKATFEAILHGFTDADGLVRGYRLGDEQEDGRSARSSFSLPLLRGGSTESRFSASERAWLADNFGLDPRINPMMVPYLQNRELFDQQPDTFSRYLRMLLEAKSDVEPKYGNSAILDINAFVAARLMETARVLDDHAIQQTGFALWGRLRQFRAGTNDVVRSIKGDMFSARGLTDYISYADAAAQEYMLTGDTLILADGAKILSRAIELYSDARSGLLDESFFEYMSPMPPDVAGPQLCDDFVESSAAMSMRVLNQYACLLAGTAEGKTYAALAQRHISRLAIAAAMMGTRAAGYYCAAWQIKRSRYAVTVGKSAIPLVKRLSALAPTTPVIAPARGRVHPELQSRPDGIYVFVGNAVEGPLALDEAARRLNDLMH